jgi:Zn-dependent peptidase ImmA (M78 family)
MNVITNEEAEKLSKASEKGLHAKAFIMNGEIYINKDLANEWDLFHEYTHILLGYLKNNKDENIRNIYFKLLEEVWKLGE